MVNLRVCDFRHRDEPEETAAEKARRKEFDGETERSSLKTSADGGPRWWTPAGASSGP